MSHTQIQRLATAAFGVALAFAVGTPTVARAVTAAELQAQYEEASNRLSTLSADVAEADAQLSETRSKMDEANASIDRLSEELGEKQAQLVEARNMLSKRVRASYKSGGVSFLGMLLQADSFEELVSTVYYADKISERDAKSIDAVDTAYAELKGKKDELEDLQTTYDSLYEQQEAELQELEQRRQEGQDYVNGLSAELRQKLEAERQEELARLREQEEQQEQEQAAPQQEEQQETPAPAEEQQPQQRTLLQIAAEGAEVRAHHAGILAPDVAQHLTAERGQRRARRHDRQAAYCREDVEHQQVADGAQRPHERIFHVKDASEHSIPLSSDFGKKFPRPKGGTGKTTHTIWGFNP